jgi:predicted metal-dependent hydrolase
MQTVDTEAFLRGVREFNAGRYFECHDTLEEIWMGASGDDRTFLQGLIQVSVGFYHYGNGNPSGALSQWGKGIEKLSGFGEAYGGLKVASLIQEIQPWSAAAVGKLSGGSTPSIKLKTPKLEFYPNSHRREPWQQ